MTGVILGVDPGAVSGALAFYDGSTYSVCDLPVVDGRLNAPALAMILRAQPINLAIVEKVGAMPKQGVASTFKFAYACGIIHGVIAAHGVAIRFVPPTVWKKHFSLAGKDKEAARALAINRHPTVTGLDLKKHHGRAEALLLIDWYHETRRNDQ